MICGVGHSCGLDPKLLWLWLWQAAVALIQPLAWELPYVGKKKKEKERMPCSEDTQNMLSEIVHIYPKLALCTFFITST